MRIPPAGPGACLLPVNFMNSLWFVLEIGGNKWYENKCKAINIYEYSDIKNCCKYIQHYYNEKKDNNLSIYRKYINDFYVNNLSMEMYLNNYIAYNILAVILTLETNLPTTGPGTSAFIRNIF